MALVMHLVYCPIVSHRKNLGSDLSCQDIFKRFRVKFYGNLSVPLFTGGWFCGVVIRVFFVLLNHFRTIYVWRRVVGFYSFLETPCRLGQLVIWVWLSRRCPGWICFRQRDHSYIAWRGGRCLADAEFISCNLRTALINSIHTCCFL